VRVPTLTNLDHLHYSTAALVARSALLVAYETSEPSLFDAVQGSGPQKATPERLARRYRPACVIDAVCPAIVTSVDRCAPVFAGMNSST
jgi:hypothetical protein